VPPDWLSPEAKAKWAEVAGILSAMGLLTIADTDALAEYCHFWAKRERMTKFVAENGETHAVKDGKGEVKCLRPFPQAYLEIKYAERCSQLRKKLGLDPAARADMARESNDAEPKSRFFKTG